MLKGFKARLNRSRDVPLNVIGYSLEYRYTELAFLGTVLFWPQADTWIYAMVKSDITFIQSSSATRSVLSSGIN